MEYKIIGGHVTPSQFESTVKSNQFESAVKLYLNDGWTLQGGVSATIENGYYTCFQAVVRNRPAVPHKLSSGSKTQETKVVSLAANDVLLEDAMVANRRSE